MTQPDLFGEHSPLDSAREQEAAAERTRSAAAGRELSPEEKEALMQAVCEPALSCTNCKLAETRTQVVFGEGSASTPLVFIGEGPGETEDKTGRPFVGRAGKLLEEALRLNGMARSHVYIANIVKCRPTLLEGGKVRNRAPDAEEVAACNGWLQAQMNIIRPMVIVCLGAPSANVVIHKNFKITQERGRWFENTAYAPWAMATLHPAYVLRQHGDAYEAAKQSLVGDIGAARQKVIEARRAARAPSKPQETLF
jgi:DNA polymerase